MGVYYNIELKISSAVFKYFLYTCTYRFENPLKINFPLYKCFTEFNSNGRFSLVKMKL